MTRAAALLLAALFLAGCSAIAPAAPRTTPRTTAAPVDWMLDTGTWEKDLNSTDCTDFTTKMTGSEQFAVSRWMLQFQRTSTVPTAAMAPDSMIREFQQDVADACGEQGGDYPIIAAGVLAYMGDKKYEPPYR